MVTVTSKGQVMLSKKIPKAAPHLAGQTFRNYRRSGGTRTSILAGFS
jgi:hypothetical protein